MFNRLIQWSLEHRLLVVVGGIAVAIAGVLALREIQMDVFPDFAPPQVVILTEAPGFSPEDVETLISLPIEAALNGTPGVVTVRSSSILGLSTIVAVFEWGTNLSAARQVVAERLRQAEEQLPEGARTPVMLPVASVIGRLLEYGLTYERDDGRGSDLDLRTICDWEIRNRLLAVPGVASVVCVGGGVKQYQVFVSPQRLKSYDLTLHEVVEALKGSNANIPGGVVTASDQEYIVTGQGRIASLEDIEHSVIKVKGGIPITVGQVAEVRFGAALKRGDASLNGGKPLVLGAVTKAFGADTLKTTQKVEEALQDMERTLPEGVRLHKALFRQASFIEATVQNLRLALLEGAVIVTAVLFLFFLNLRPSLVTFLAMPISLLLALIVLRLFHVGINTMTIGGMSVALGGVVDDAIIDAENIFRRLRENQRRSNPEPALAVIYKASVEIRASVVYATFITMVVFLPVFFLSGPEGRIFTPLGLSYIVAIFASLLVAFTQTPVLCSLFLTKGRGLEKESVTVAWMKRIYQKILDWSLPRPRTIVGISVALLLSAMAIIPFLGRSFLPEFHEGNFIIAMTALPGTSLEESMRLGKKVQEVLLKYPEVISVVQRVGVGEVGEEVSPVNFSEFDVTLEFKDRDPDMLLRAIREDLSKLPGVAVNVGQFIAHRMDEALSGVTAQIAVKIFGPDLSLLREKGEEVRAILQGVKGVTDLQLEPIFNVPQLAIKVDRPAAARYGLKSEDVLRFAEAALNGLVISQVLEGQKSFDMVVRFDEASRGNIEALQSLLLDTPTGARVPLSQVAEITVDERPYIINRENVLRRIVVQSNVEGRDLHGVISEIQEKVRSQGKLPPGYFVQYGGQFESQQRSQRIITSLGLAAILVIFLLLFQAFGSARAALLVMVNLPLALIGGVFAVLLTDQTLSVSSLIGFVAVFGIAARNGIILLTHYQHLIWERGRSLEEAVIQGSLDRLSPVLMTASVAALGLFPLVVGSPVGKELERPLAWVILGGLATSTFLNLIVVPTLVRRFGIGGQEGGKPET
ncbi:MAG: efflux RND transporter permease subunit [candidate division NC10 bacterium]|nr:efflux RND transporter permease subunit [candidate division NC10 bacterium]